MKLSMKSFAIFVLLQVIVVFFIFFFSVLYSEYCGAPRSSIPVMKCASAGIELVGFNQIPENVSSVSGSFPVKYKGEELTCFQGELIEPEAYCFFPSFNEDQPLDFGVYVNSTHCFLREDVGLVSPCLPLIEKRGCGFNCDVNWMGVLLVLLVMFVIADALFYGFVRKH